VSVRQYQQPEWLKQMTIECRFSCDLLHSSVSSWHILLPHHKLSTSWTFSSVRLLYDIVNIAFAVCGLRWINQNSRIRRFVSNWPVFFGNLVISLIAPYQLWVFSFKFGLLYITFCMFRPINVQWYYGYRTIVKSRRKTRYVIAVYKNENLLNGTRNSYKI